MTTTNDLDLGVSVDDLALDELRYDGRSGRFTWRSQPDNDLGKSFVLVILGELPRTRVLYGERVGDPIRCSSPDGIEPVAELAAAIGAGPFCNVCKFGQWEKDAAGKWIKPACSEQLNYACAEVAQEQPLPFKFAVRGTAIKTFTNRADGIMTVRAREAIRSRTPAYTMAIELLAGQRIKFAGGDYFPLAGRVLFVDGKPVTVGEEQFTTYSELRGLIGLPTTARTLAAPKRPAALAADPDALPLFDAHGNDL